MRASSLNFRTAVCLGIVGIGMGIAMAASGDHSVFPAHAHLNLLGWVSLFLIGIFYRFHPALDTSRIAFVQSLIWIVGTIVLTIGVAGIYLGRTELEPIAIVGSMLVLGGAALGWTTFDLAAKAVVGSNTVNRFEAGQDARVSSVEKMRLAQEKAGVQFIPENGGGPGVRLAKGKSH